jgi:predicted amidohydrolase
MLRLALVQLRCEKGDLAGNLARHAQHIGAAAARGVDIVCFPEMSLTGYVDSLRMPHGVVALDSALVADFVALTRGRALTAIAGIIEPHTGDEKPYITQLVARDGQLLGLYRKLTIVHEEAAWFTPGAGAPLFEHGGVPFGLAICADIDTREVFARAAAQGARLVLHPSAPGLYGAQATRDWSACYAWWRDGCHAKLGAYAREFGLYIATATQAGRTSDEDFPGGGFLFGPDGTCLAETLDWSEGVLDVDIPEL